MQMHPDGFSLQPRGPYLFDRWQWPERVPTKLGELIVELTTSNGGRPDVAMASAASEIATFAAANGELLLDLIYGHYRYAEESNWLAFWKVPPGLGRDQVLSQVRSVELAVSRDQHGQCDAWVYVNPKWDPEHKLDLNYRDGKIVAVNGEPFTLMGEVLRPDRDE
jgi:hypothetical protein